jgi:23S rRNA pseudouridine2605 synthase
VPAIPPGERLQKVVAQAGLASRRQAEDWIRAGRVTVNGVAATLGQRVTPRDDLRVDGRPVRHARAASQPDFARSVFLCHRSPGEELQGGLLERLPHRAGKRFVAVSPMPQIDGGLELVTSDGALAARLQRSVRESPAEFSVRARGDIDAVRREALLAGQLDDGSTVRVVSLQDEAAEEGDGTNRWYQLGAIGASGKSVRQLFERQGLLVSRVLRVVLGPLKLTRDIGRGQFRVLNADEALALKTLLDPEPEAAVEPAPTPVRRPRNASGPRPSRPKPSLKNPDTARLEESGPARREQARPSRGPPRAAARGAPRGAPTGRRRSRP